MLLLVRMGKDVDSLIPVRYSDLNAEAYFIGTTICPPESNTCKT